jgi:hypothetical protein
MGRRVGYVAWAVGVAFALAGGGCGRERGRADDPFLSRPAPGPDGRVALVSQSRIWIAAVGQDSTWQAEPLPLEVPADRPHWLVPSTPDSQRAELAMIAWYEQVPEESELAIWNGKDLHRLTITAGSELLNDTAPDGRLLFEREGMLFEAAVERSADGIRIGQETQLVPGRDARYTPDGQHVLFVRGHESDPLGIWRQGYQGGDDSEIHHLDLTSGTVTQLTDTPDNDECPVPLDNAGRRFMVCRERGGACYRPWVVEVITEKKHRVRRMPMPEGPWPVVFPAVRWLRPAPANRHPIFALIAGDTSLSIEVWAEANGELIMSRGEVQPRQLAFPTAERVPMRLAEAALPRELSKNKLGDREARKFSLDLANAINSSRLAGRHWKAIPASDRGRLHRAAGGASSVPEREEIVLRLLGRCGLPGFDYWAPGRRMPVSHTVHGGTMVKDDSTGIWIRDLRGYELSLTTGGGEAALRSGDFAWAGKLCAERKGPGVVLIDEKTAGLAEVMAAGYREQKCAILVGRTTAGLAMEVERHPIPIQASVEKSPLVVFTVPIAPARITPETTVGPEGVVPDRFVPAGASEEVWQAAVNEARERLRR